MTELHVYHNVQVSSPVLVMGFTGWMDGGSVSTGTISYLVDKLQATKVAEIDSRDFYIFNFPVSTLPIPVYSAEGKTVVASLRPMEFAAIFRPHTRIEGGLVEELNYPANSFWYSQQRDLMLFRGEEPHIRWGAYCDCIYEFAHRFGIEALYFVGSVASPIPHTREPRIRASVSSESLKQDLESAGINFTEYEGPASIVTSLAHHAEAAAVHMISLVVEIPHYPFLEMPIYPKSIIKVLSALNKLLGLDIDWTDLQESAKVTDAKLDTLMAENKEFGRLVRRLEEAYDLEEPGDEELLKRLLEEIELEDSEDQ